MPISFPIADAPPPAPAPPAYVIARSFGSVNLNDRSVTFFDKLEVPGTRFLQPEQLVNRDGQMVMVRVDRKMLVMTAYIVVMESPVYDFYTFTRALEDATEHGADFVVGGGWKYTNCYASEIVGTQSGILSLGPPLQRVMKVSFKVTSQYTARQPV